VEGRVGYNDGEFAEAQIVGIEGIEKDFWLATIQIHREDTNDTPDEFQRRFPVDMWLDILTITDITAQTTERTPQNEDCDENGRRLDSIQ
jgi:hypothetical protein